jgi:hypothetical protein
MHWGESPYEGTLCGMNPLNIFESFNRIVSWIPGILLQVGIGVYALTKLEKHYRPATRALISIGSSLILNILQFATFEFYIRSSFRGRWYSYVSLGFQILHIVPAVLLISAVFMDREPRPQATQLFPPQTH